MKNIILISIVCSLFVNCSKKQDIDENINEGNLGSESQGIAVSNAGLVIINSYYQIIFKRLNLTDNNNQFISESERTKALYCLQYLATGLAQAGESSVALNKIFCGIGTQDAIGDSVSISAQDKVLMDGILQSAIAYWAALGSVSKNQFRADWLLRQGVLTETEESWKLTVSTKQYDVLLMKSPFSFSIIKLPWMSKPLQVTWQY